MSRTPKNLSRQYKPQSSRDLSAYTTQELDQLRKSNATQVLTKRQAIRLFFWDSERRTFCCLTKQSWLFLLIFYPIFVGFIAALFMGTMQLVLLYIKIYGSDVPIVNKHSLTGDPIYAPKLTINKI